MDKIQLTDEGDPRLYNPGLRPRTKWIIGGTVIGAVLVAVVLSKQNLKQNLRSIIQTIRVIY
jgi:hypothetical protein